MLHICLVLPLLHLKEPQLRIHSLIADGFTQCLQQQLMPRSESGCYPELVIQFRDCQHISKTKRRRMNIEVGTVSLSLPPVSVPRGSLVATCLPGQCQGLFSQSDTTTPTSRLASPTGMTLWHTSSIQDAELAGLPSTAGDSESDATRELQKLIYHTTITNLCVHVLVQL